MKKTGQKKYISIFTKSVYAFLAIGIAPMLVMGFSIYHNYSGMITESILSSSSQMTSYLEKNIEEFLAEMDSNTKYLYQYNISSYDYFYQLLQDSGITEAKRETLVNDILKSILYRNEYIDHVYFVKENGEIFSVRRIPDKKLDRDKMRDFCTQNTSVSEKDFFLIPTHRADYYENCQDVDFTVARNIFNTRTAVTASSEVLGTVYIDINNRYFESLMQAVQEKAMQSISIIEESTGGIIFTDINSEYGNVNRGYSEYKNKIQDDRGRIEVADRFIVYSRIKGSGWLLLNEMSPEQINMPYREIRKYTIIIILISTALLGVIYLFYVRKTSRPMKELILTMGRIQKGDLSVRTGVGTNDEISLIARGLNEMTEKLQEHINQVYVAEIKQRDAQLEALKMQIQPHYLYNTLDVIRMSAIMNQDTLTADMLDSLSNQLKYTIGTNRDMVNLRTELESIENYFKLISIRFNHKYELEITVPEELWKYQVPKLILQPIVENAVNHGLRARSGGGKIEISAKRESGSIEMSIMDNGAGMNREKLEAICQLIRGSSPGIRVGESWESIGIKNVNDRIQIQFGNEFGLCLDSYEGLGTIVKYTLPLIQTGV